MQDSHQINNNNNNADDRDMLEIKNEIKSLKATIDNLSEKILLLTNITSTMQTNLNELCDKISKIEEENNENKQKISRLETKVTKVEQENTESEQKITILQHKLNQIEQQNIKNNVEVVNIPTTTALCPIETVFAIGRASNISLDERDVLDAYRVKNKNKLIIKFSSFTIKKRFMQKAREQKLNNNMLIDDNAGDDNVNKKKMYFNDQLTKENKKLFWAAQTKAKQNKWKFVWIKEGRILCKKNEKTAVKYINTEEDINNL